MSFLSRLKLPSLMGDESAWPRRVRNVMWVSAVFFFIGYMPTTLFGSSMPAMVLAAVGTIPLGAKSPSPLKGALRGLGVGLLAGLGIGGVLAGKFTTYVPMETRLQPVGLYAVATAAMCMVIGLVFAVSARHRAKLLDQTWKQER
jgi:hypothetical protein